MPDNSSSATGHPRTIQTDMDTLRQSASLYWHAGQRPSTGIENPICGFELLLEKLDLKVSTVELMDRLSPMMTITDEAALRALLQFLQVSTARQNAPTGAPPGPCSTVTDPAPPIPRDLVIRASALPPCPPEAARGKRIVMVSGEFPNPMHGGGRIVADWIKALSQHNEIYLLTWYIKERDEQAREQLSPYCKVIQGLSRPDFDRGSHSVLQNLTGGIEPDLTYYLWPRALNYAGPRWGRRQGFAFIESVSLRLRMDMDLVPPFSEKWLRLFIETVRMLHDEVLNTTDQHARIVLTGKDGLFLSRFNPLQPFYVVRTGITIQASSPSAPEPNSVVFAGNFLHYPNEDALVYFFDHIYEQVRKTIPGLKVFIVGANPTEKVRSYHNGTSIVVTGPVENIDAWIQKGAVCIAPLISGAGVRTKLQHYAALQRPIVASPIAATDLAYEDGTDILVASTPAQFAAHIIYLLSNKEAAATMAANALARTRQHYSAEAVIDDFYRIHQEIEIHPCALLPRHHTPVPTPESSTGKTSAGEMDEALFFLRVASYLEAQGIRSLAIYGAGQHTRRLLEATEQWHQFKELMIIDDQPAMQGKHILGIPVRAPDQALRTGFAAMLISSDSAESQLCEKASKWVPNLIPVYCLYKPAPGCHLLSSDRLITQPVDGSTSPSREETTWNSISRYTPLLGEFAWHIQTVDSRIPGISDAHYQEVLRAVERAGISADKMKGMQILEIGAYAHTTGYQLCTKNGAHVTLFDLSARNLALGRKLAAVSKSKLQPRLVSGDFHNLPFENDSFDFVYMSSTLHHTWNVRQVLMESFRVLAPGGLLFLENEPCLRKACFYSFRTHRIEAFTPFEKQLETSGLIRTIAEPYLGSRPETLFGMTENQRVPLDWLLNFAAHYSDLIGVDLFLEGMLGPLEKAWLNRRHHPVDELAIHISATLNEQLDKAKELLTSKEKGLGFSLPFDSEVRQFSLAMARLLKQIPDTGAPGYRTFIADIFGAPVRLLVRKRGKASATATGEFNRTCAKKNGIFYDFPPDIQNFLMHRNSIMPDIQEGLTDNVISCFPSDDWELGGQAPRHAMVLRATAGRIQIPPAGDLLLLMRCHANECPNHGYRVRLYHDDQLISTHDIWKGESFLIQKQLTSSRAGRPLGLRFVLEPMGGVSAQVPARGGLAVSFAAAYNLENKRTKIIPAARDTAKLAAPARLSPPPVSIIVVGFNKADYTEKCIQAIRKHTDPALYELIVVDNASTDRTPALLKSMGSDFPNLRTVQNPENLGFGWGNNRGSEFATGAFLIFLNNDTEVKPGWLQPLLATMTEHPQAGIVGSKLIYPDGRLQEAGGIIFQDGGGFNFGRYDRPEKPDYNYVRETDYVSGAAMMIRSELFQQLGGFDFRYNPAYYEDVDLCFGARSLGWRVIYQPDSAVVHHEGITAGTSVTGGAKEYQAIHRRTFMQKWAAALGHQPRLAIHPRALWKAGNRRGRHGRQIIILADVLPLAQGPQSLEYLLSVTGHFINEGHSVTLAVKYGITRLSDPDGARVYNRLRQSGIMVVLLDENTAAIPKACEQTLADLFERHEYDAALILSDASEFAWFHRQLDKHGNTNILLLNSIPGVSQSPATAGKRPGADKRLITWQCNICGQGACSHPENLGRETRSCPRCGSISRWRVVIHALSMELWGKSLVLDDFPIRPEVRGLGMSDWPGYAVPLSNKVNFTNTYYHKEPRLDITKPAPAFVGTADFLISSDVFEHVPPPIHNAFVQARRILKPGGILLLTVPYSREETTREHYPDLFDYSISQVEGKKILKNITRAGTTECFDNLVFHGGDGSTLEMRLFSEKGLLADLHGAGFSDIKIWNENYPGRGLVWNSLCSLLVTARNPANPDLPPDDQPNTSTAP